MPAALRYEVVRVTTVRSTWIMAALTLLVGLGLGWLASAPAEIVDPDTGTVVGTGPVLFWQAFTVPLLLSAVLASVVAAQSIGQEYRFGLVRLTLTAFPRRRRILVAKVVVAAGAAAALAAVSYAGSFLAVLLRGQPLPPTPLEEGSLLLRGVVFVVLWALSAFAIAGLTRQTAIGIAVPIISGLIVEQILEALLRQRAAWLVDVLPWSTAARWDATAPGPVTEGSGGTAVLDVPPVGWSAVGVFAVWVVALLALQAWAFLRRDA